METSEKTKLPFDMLKLGFELGEKISTRSLLFRSLSPLTRSLLILSPCYSHFVQDVVPSSDGQFALSGSWDGELHLWDLASGTTARRFVGHTKDVLSVSFSLDNRQIVSASRDRSISIKLWNTLGSIFFAFSAPILVIAFLAIAHLLISGDEEFQLMKSSKHPRFRLWTFPVIVDGPFGVVSAAELIGILLFSIYVIWAVYAYTLVNFKVLSEFQLTFQEKCYLVLELTGLRLGMIGLFCLVFLFLPVARGSVLLRLVDIPFEVATRYHVWLGHLIMLVFTLHGLLYIIAWALQGELLSEILEWKTIGVANLAGVISLAAGLFMWVTSLPPVRRQNFELFFYRHLLYIVFVVFLAMHVGDFVFSIAAGGIFLFILDRFLRFCQSRRTGNVISASCSPCGTVELVVSKPARIILAAMASFQRLIESFGRKAPYVDSH